MPAFVMCLVAVIIWGNISLADSMGILYPDELSQQLKQAIQKKGPDYQPRTEHLTSDGRAIYTNRLILDSSPYLVQHAHNPVNWYSWGPEAFAQAKKEDKLVFLSVGYSTCHWCHVMEKESFENLLVAKILNEHFIAIKVDREQRPDLDATFMAAVMLMQGSGGWPMTVFLTPAGQPFYGGTYYPAEHLMKLLGRVNELWQSESDKVIQTAGQVTAAVKKQSSTKAATVKINQAVIARAIEMILGRYDDMQGGFSQAPKFPNEAYLFLLLDKLARKNDDRLFNAMQETLDAMAEGGIYDQVGGGFHRYSIDNQWLVPHFEKMLYNQAHLGRIYSQFYEISQDTAYARTTRQILDYVLRDMTSPEGGLYSASDADSEGEEGLFFLWRLDELQAVLDQKQLQLVVDLFGVTQEGNFEQQNILIKTADLKTFAEDKKLPLTQVLSEVDALREKLYQMREKRIHPFTDKKVLTAWNGMMITTFVQASHQLDEPKYLQAAIRAADYLNNKNYSKAKNQLWRSSLDGLATVLASQEDYAYYAQALIQLYDATQDKIWLSRAEQISNSMLELFWDKTDGGFFMDNPGQGMALIIRPKDLYDGAIPSGNSIAMEVLSALFKRTGKPLYEQKLEQLVASLSAKIEKVPNAFAYLLAALKQFKQGEIGHVQYGARGKLRAELIENTQTSESDRSYTLQLTIDDKWHINSHHPKQDDLIKTELSLAKTAASSSKKKEIRLKSVEYPNAVDKRLSFSNAPSNELLSLYEGQVEFKLRIKQKKSTEAKADSLEAKRPAQVVPIVFSYQACSEQICLTPEKLLFYTYF